MIPASITQKTLHNSRKYISLIIKPRDTSYSWIAGQWIDLTSPHFYNKTKNNTEQRIPVGGYSFCSPTGSGDFEILIRKSNHPVTEWIFEQIEIEVSLDILIGKASGNFQYNPEIHTNIVCLAGGVGITPLISMIRTQRQYQTNNTDPTTTAMLYHSIKTKDDILFPNEFSSNDKIFISQENNKINFKDVAKQHGNVDYFICGPTSFIDDAVCDLKSCGCEKLHFEKWW